MIVDVLTHFTVAAAAYFFAYFSGSYAYGALWAFALHTSYCMYFGDRATMTIGTGDRELNFTQAWGYYLITTVVWALAGNMLNYVLANPRLLDGRYLGENREHDPLALLYIALYALMYAGALVPFELKVIGLEPMGGIITVVLLVLVSFLYFWLVKGTSYYETHDVPRNETIYFLIPLVAYGVTFVVLDAVDFTYGHFVQWHSQNWNFWLTLALGAVAASIYPLLLNRVTRELTPAQRAVNAQLPFIKLA
jgi:hypothetical protein